MTSAAPGPDWQVRTLVEHQRWEVKGVDERVERLVGAVESLRRCHSALTPRDPALAAVDCTAALQVVARAEGVLASIKAGLLLAYQASGKLGANGDKDLAGYAGRTLNRGRAGGRKDAALARGLATLQETERDLATGAITPGHAQILADTLERASQARKTALLEEGGQGRLLAAARRQDVGEFAKTVRRWEHTTDRAQADAAADGAHRARCLRTFTRRDGCVKVDGLLDPIGGQALLVALDAVAPTKLAADDERTGEQRRADALVDLALLANRGGSVKPGALTPTQVVVHMPARTLVRGLAEQLLLHDDLAPGGARDGRAHDPLCDEVGGTPRAGRLGRGPTGTHDTGAHDTGAHGTRSRDTIVDEVGSHDLWGHDTLGPEPGVVDADVHRGRAHDTGSSGGIGSEPETDTNDGHALRGLVAEAADRSRAPEGPVSGDSISGGARYEPATLEGGFALSLATAMMLVCDSVLMRLVVDADGVPLDVGRSQRVWAKEQRLAVFARDQGCRYPGCGRPSRWCDVHHIHTWADGGVTSIDNGITLCRAHHTLVHTQGVRITPIAGGFRFVARTGLVVGENRHVTAIALDPTREAHPRADEAIGSRGSPPRGQASAGSSSSRNPDDHDGAHELAGAGEPQSQGSAQRCHR